jgi:UDP-N-acetylmuramate dehydrogenase
MGRAVVHVLTRGIGSSEGEADARARPGRRARGTLRRDLRRDGLRGLECLSGIPGSVGRHADPERRRLWARRSPTRSARCARFDRDSGEVVELSRAECAFAYRSSRFRGSRRWVILEVEFELPRSRESLPIRYAELARALGRRVGQTAPDRGGARAGPGAAPRKGMVVDAEDPESVSAGSFFTNPILSPADFDALAGASPSASVPTPAARLSRADGRVKTSAAWLIERAGFARGYGEGPAGISAKHTLALVNRGGRRPRRLLRVAARSPAGVHEAFGVRLEPEPIFVGHAWEGDAAPDARAGTPDPPAADASVAQAVPSSERLDEKRSARRPTRAAAPWSGSTESASVSIDSLMSSMRSSDSMTGIHRLGELLGLAVQLARDGVQRARHVDQLGGLAGDRGGVPVELVDLDLQLVQARDQRLAAGGVLPHAVGERVEVIERA